MKKVRAAIVGYGNIGHYVLEALQAAPDFEIAGVVRRAGAENKPEELANYAVVKDIKELGEVDVAILCTPTRSNCSERHHLHQLRSRYEHGTHSSRKSD